MKFDLSYIMKKAWDIKRKADTEVRNRKFNHNDFSPLADSEKALFSECLKEAWRIAKTETVGKNIVVKEWFLNKNFSQDERYMIDISYSAVVERETQKASLVKFTNEYGSKAYWIPKSCLLIAM